MVTTSTVLFANIVTYWYILEEFFYVIAIVNCFQNLTRNGWWSTLSNSTCLYQLHMSSWNGFFRLLSPINRCHTIILYSFLQSNMIVLIYPTIYLFLFLFCGHRWSCFHIFWWSCAWWITKCCGTDLLSSPQQRYTLHSAHSRDTSSGPKLASFILPILKTR